MASRALLPLTFNPKKRTMTKTAQQIEKLKTAKALMTEFISEINCEEVIGDIDNHISALVDKQIAINHRKEMRALTADSIIEVDGAGSLDISKITQIYIGGDRCCRCGCEGEYHASNQASFMKAVKRFIKLAGAGYHIDGEQDGYWNITTRDATERSYGKAITIYFE